MRKRSIVTAVGAGVIGASAASYFLMNENQKEKVKDKFSNMTNMFSNGDVATTFEKAGKPDQLESRDIADLENAKMVSEGSQFGVQYYNENDVNEEYN
ncbi:hypothetical protein [Oceanobacillus sp. CAU 1775]